MSQFEPIETEISRLVDDHVILTIGHRDGIRRGQIFEIYSSTSGQYVGLVRVIEARRREAVAEIIHREIAMSSGDIADEVEGGRMAIYGFFSQDGTETNLSKSIQEMMITYFARQLDFDVIERNQLEQHLEEMKLSYTGLLAKDAPEVGSLLGAELIVIGSITVLSDEIIVNARMNETETGRMLSSSSLRLYRAPSIDALLGTTIGELQRETDIDRLEISPKNNTASAR